MAKAPEETINFHADGRVTLAVAGGSWRLRRATIGESRDFAERLTDIKTWCEEVVADHRQAVEDAKSDDTPIPVLDDIEFSAELGDRVIAAWVWLTETLAPDAKVALSSIDAADLPPWITDVPLLSEFPEHWRQAPLGGPLPSQRTQERNAAILQQARALLPASPNGRAASASATS